jgi:hypothetical protein
LVEIIKIKDDRDFREQLEMLDIDDLLIIFGFYANTISGIRNIALNSNVNDLDGLKKKQE